MKIALQLYTVWDHCGNGQQLLQTLEQVKEAGYEGVEFAGTHHLSAECLKEKLDQLGLVPLASHESLEDLDNHLEELLRYHQTLGTGALVCAYAQTDSPDSLERLERTLIRAKQMAAPYGIQILYHNHSHEFQERDGDCPMEEIQQCCPLELDTYWAFYSGKEVSQYMKTHRDRIGLLHLKDGNAEGIPCAIGEGCNHIPAILQTAKEIGMEWVIVENDDPIPDGLSDMRRSIQNVKQYDI